MGDPARRRWKLWHLAALVAGAAGVLAVEHASSGLLPGLILTTILFAPALLATWIGPKLTRRLLRRARVPRRSFRALFIRAVLSALFCWGWVRWIAFVFARGQDLWKD